MVFIFFMPPISKRGMNCMTRVTILVSLILILVKIRSLVLIQLVLAAQRPGLQEGDGGG